MVSPSKSRRTSRGVRRTTAFITASLFTTGFQPAIAFAQATNLDGQSQQQSVSNVPGGDAAQSSTSVAQPQTSSETSTQPSATPEQPTDITAKAAEQVNQAKDTVNQAAQNAKLPGLAATADNATAASSETIEVEDKGAKVTITKAATSGGKIHLKGEGWKNDNNSPSTITIKVKGYKAEDGSETTYSRGSAATGKDGDTRDYLNHPGTGEPDKTIFWTFKADENGTFDKEETLPLGLTAGQGLKLNIASGLVKGDTQRSITTPSLVVDGEEYVEKANNKAKCETDLSYPEVTIGDQVVDGKVHLDGKGYCNSNGGGAKVAFKLDEGKVERVNDDIDSNRTIWYITQADDKGNFSIDMPLPDGTNQGNLGTAKPFEKGEHTVRVLSGSLQDGDPVSTNPRPKAKKLTFIYGEYKPTGVSDPVLPSTLTSANANGVTATKSGNDIVVTVPSGQKGDWVQSVAYPDNTSRTWWGADWYQLDDNKQYTLKGNDQIKEGPFKLTVSNGNQGKNGQLIGWTEFTYKEKSASGASKKATTSQIPADSPQNVDKALKDIDAEIKKMDTAFDGLLKAAGSSVGGASASGAQSTSSNSAAATTTKKKSTKKTTTKKTTTASASRATGATVNRVTTTGGTRTATTRSTSGTSGSTGGTARVVNSGTSGTSGTRSTAGGSTAASSSAAANSKAQPKNTPKPPVKTRDQLTSKNAYGVTGTLKNETLTMKIPKLKAGDWTYLYIYSADTSQNPVGVSWVQVDSTGSVKLDTKDLADGEYTVAAVDEKGALVGWVDIKLGDIKNAAVTDDSEEGSEETVAQARLMGASDWWLIGASLLIPLLTASAIYAFRRPRRS